MSDPILRIDGLAKRFVLHNIGGRVVDALRGVSLTVAPGEHVAVAGSSGSGKSSLLKCVYRTYLPTAGRVEFVTAAGPVVDLAALDDREVAVVRERQIGYVSQFLRAEPRRAALDVVARAGARRGLGPAEARQSAAEALRRVSLPEDLWGTYPSLLSGGEQQRVNLAAAAVSAPRLLLLDEPVSALDPANREAVLSLIEALRLAGVALLGVFHDPDIIRTSATRLVGLAEGRVVADGDPDEVLAVLRARM